MGSIDKACISGFLCRLCSEMHRMVIHIYGDQGRQHSLVEKINGYLPITISPTDPLPKTICETCLRRVEQHYDLLLRLEQYREKKFSMYKKLPQISSLCRTPARTSIGTNTETVSEPQTIISRIDLTTTEETDSFDTEDGDSSETEVDDLDVIALLTNTNSSTTDMDCDLLINNNNNNNNNNNSNSNSNINLPSTSSQQQSQEIQGSK